MCQREFMHDHPDLVARDEDGDGDDDDVDDVAGADSRKRKRPRVLKHFWGAFEDFLKDMREKLGDDFRDPGWSG